MGSDGFIYHLIYVPCWIEILPNAKDNGRKCNGSNLLIQCWPNICKVFTSNFLTGAFPAQLTLKQV